MDEYPSQRDPALDAAPNVVRAPARDPQPSRLPWMIGLLALLIAVLLAPRLIEQIEYAITRGRLRAEVESARSQLPAPALVELSRQFATVAQAIAPSVVHIDTIQVI